MKKIIKTASIVLAFILALSSLPSFAFLSTGDINNDGSINSADYLLVKRFFSGDFDFTSDQMARADINGDSAITTIDYHKIKQHLRGEIDLTAVSGSSYSSKFADSPALYSGADVRVMSFNILAELWDSSAVIEGREPIMEGIFTYYLPDVIGMQEVSDKWYTKLKPIFGAKYAFVDEVNGEGKTNFSPLAYNQTTLEIVKHGVKVFSQGNDRRLRLMSWAIFMKKSTGKQFAVVNTHWDISSNSSMQESQSAEMATYVSRLHSKYNIPVICTGDFNVEESSSYFKSFMNTTGFIDAKYSATKIKRAYKTTHSLGSAPSSSKKNSIDHIVGSTDTKFKFYNFLVDSYVLRASDHCPVYVDIDLD